MVINAGRWWLMQQLEVLVLENVSESEWTVSRLHRPVWMNCRYPVLNLYELFHDYIELNCWYPVLNELLHDYIDLYWIWMNSHTRLHVPQRTQLLLNEIGFKCKKTQNKKCYFALLTVLDERRRLQSPFGVAAAEHSHREVAKTRPRAVGVVR